MANPLEKISPPQSVAHVQSEPSHDRMILLHHLLLGSLAIERAPGGLPVGTGPADCVGRGDHLDLTVGILAQCPVDGRHIGDEFGTVPLPAKSLQTQERMTSETDWRGRILGSVKIGHGKTK
jgi:hypothetical protein